MKTINPYRLFVGSFIPNWLQCRKEVSDGAKIVYARLCQYAGADGKCNPSATTLARDIGKSRRQTLRLIAELRDLNLIFVIENKEGDRYRTNDYKFLEHAWMFYENENDIHAGG